MSCDREGPGDIDDTQVAGVAVQNGQTRQGRRLGSWGLKKLTRPWSGNRAIVGGVQLVIHGGVQIIDHFPVGAEDAHAEVELHAGDCAVESDIAQRFRFDDHSVTRGVTAVSVEHFCGNRKSGRRERVIAGCFLQRLRGDELLKLLGVAFSLVRPT